MRALNTLVNVLAGRERHLAFLIICLVVLTSWVATVMSGDQIKSADERAFFAIAQSLAFEGRFAENGELTAYRAPGQAFFLAPFVRFGAGMTELRLLGGVLIGLGLLLAFDLVRRRAGPLAGLLAVGMIPCWPPILYSSTTLYPQTLGAFLLVLLIWLLDRLSDEPKISRVVLAGLTYGALVLTVPIFVLMSPIFAVWILLSVQQGFSRLVIFGVVSAALTCSWTVRNYVVFDAFVPVASSSGYNLLAGNTANARYNTSLNIRFPEHVYTEITGVGEIERSKIFTRTALEEISADPARVARLYGAKFLHWFHYSNRLLSDDVIEGGASGVSVGARDLILLVTYMVIVLPLAMRLVMLRRYPFRKIEVLSVALWIGLGLVYAIYFTRVRFRIPVDWLIISSNAMFLACLIEDRVRNFRERRLI